MTHYTRSLGTLLWSTLLWPLCKWLWSKVLRPCGKWLFTDQKILGNLISACGTIVAALIVFQGFHKLQLSLDVTAKVAGEIEKLADPQKQSFAVPALVRYANTDADSVVSNIIIVLDDEDPGIRRVCYRVLQNIKDRDKVVKLLKEELRANPSHSSGVPSALLELAQPKTSGDIFDLLSASLGKDERLESKASCALALGELGDKRALDPLMTCLNNVAAAPALRKKCTIGLAMLFRDLSGADAKTAASALSEYVYDPNLSAEAVSAFCERRQLNDVLASDVKRTVSGALATHLRQAEAQEGLLAKCADALSEIAGGDDLEDLLTALSSRRLPESAEERVLDIVFTVGGSAVRPRVENALKGRKLSRRIEMRLQYWKNRATR